MERRTLQVGAAVILVALVFRLLGSSAMQTAVQTFRGQNITQILLFLETGRVVRKPPEILENTSKQEAEQPETTPSETIAVMAENLAPSPKSVSFASGDASLISLRNTAGHKVDTAASLLTPLSWELTGDAPTVLILHTHATESYVNSENYPEASAYRTLDEGYNMISVGDRLAQALTQKGISVLHDRTLHDYPSYNGAYTQSRETVAKYLAQYPSIQLVLDLHRDAVTDGDGNQVGHSLATDAGSAAKLMLVVGSDSASLRHVNWQENFSLAVKLHAQLEKVQPGICRPLNLRASRFNQDLMGGMVLVEMGAAGNTRQEALLSADILAQAIFDLAHGCVS